MSFPASAEHQALEDDLEVEDEETSHFGKGFHSVPMAGSDGM